MFTSVLTAYEDDREEYWTRLNYGMAAVKTKQVCEVEGYWIHTVHLVLPQIPGDGLSRIPDPGSASCDGPCLKLKGFLKATQALVLVMQDSGNQNG